MATDDHLTIGGADKAQPELRVPALVYSRIVGYMTPVQHWNAGKQAEFEDRAMFAVGKVPHSSGHIGGHDDDV
jgi:ribonucleoside-triphosphate reductase (formate)